MWNHPSNKWGTFNEYAGYSEARDEIINLMEVRNNGATYDASYNSALSKGWHIGPTAGQDHHGTEWGTVNELRTVIRTDDFTEAGLYWALSRRHVYATVDKNFQIYYDMVVDGQTYQMGDIAKCGENATITAILELFQPDGEAIGKVEIIGKNSVVVYTINLSDSYAYLEIPLDGAQPYYYIRVTPADKQLAYTAPIWLEACTEHSVKVDEAVLPTCTVSGLTEGSHCELCGMILTEQEMIPATGHSYTYTDLGDGSHKAVCSLCGFTATEAHGFTDGACPCGAKESLDPIMDAKITNGHTQNLASDISINYAVEAKLLSGYDSFYLSCVLPVYEGNTFTGTTTVEVQPVLNGSYYYFTLNGLTAVQVNNMIDATLNMTKGQKSYASNVDSYSIATYAYAQLSKSSASKALKELCTELLRYSAKAQIYKGYRTDALADASLTAEQIALQSDLESVVFGNTNSVGNELSSPAVVWEGKSLTLNSKVTLKFIFSAKNFTGNIANLTLRVSYKDIYGNTVSKTVSDPQITVVNPGNY